MPENPPTPELTPERVRADVAALLGCPAAELDDSEDLFEDGLDSVRLMSLVERWRREGASGLEYADLAEEPVLARWTDLVTGRR